LGVLLYEILSCLKRVSRMKETSRRRPCVLKLRHHGVEMSIERRPHASDCAGLLVAAGAHSCVGLVPKFSLHVVPELKVRISRYARFAFIEDQATVWRYCDPRIEAAIAFCDSAILAPLYRALDGADH